MLASIGIFLLPVESTNSKSKFLPSPFLATKAAPISVSLAFGAHSYASTVSGTVGNWPSGSTVCFTPTLFPEVLNAKQGNSMCHFQVFGMTRPGIEPRPTTYNASIIPMGHGRN